MPNPTHGGRRPGAGRKPLPDDERRTKTITYRVDDATFAALSEQAGEGETAHTVARGIVERAVRRRARRTT